MNIKNLLLILVLAGGWRLTAIGVEEAKRGRVALVVGNNRYETEVGPLRNTVNDARAMAKTLRMLGFEVIEKHNVSRDELLGALVQFRGRLRGAEVGLFYFAGHGITVAGANYLLPVKSGYRPEGSVESDLRLWAETKLFNAEQAVAEMSHAGAACNLVILDACRSTPVARDARTRDAATAGGLVEMNPPAGSLVAFATDSGHTANDGGGTNGLYTEELIKQLLTPGLSIEQVFKRTRAGVMARSGGAQIPAEYSRLVGDDIFLVRDASVRRAEAAPTLAQINQLAAGGDAGQCIEALRKRGLDARADGPLATLLERVKGSLRDPKTAAANAEKALGVCDLVLGAINDCLPAGHPQRAALTAKAQNRRGDALLLLGRAEEALTSYNAAAELAPEDGYILYNRGRALLALHRTDEARADFTTTAGVKFKGSGVRKLAQAALAAVK